MVNDGEIPVQVQVVTKSPIPAIAQPWVDLVHTIGLPWALLIALGWFGYPIAKAMNDSMNKLNDHAVKAMPLLERASQAIPLLEEINRGQLRATNQKHADTMDLKAAVEAKESN